MSGDASDNPHDQPADAGGVGLKASSAKKRPSKICREYKRACRKYKPYGHRALEYVKEWSVPAFTGALVVVGLLQVRIARQQAELSRRATEAAVDASNSSYWAALTAEQSLQRQIAGEKDTAELLEATKDATLATQEISISTMAAVLEAYAANEQAQEANAIAKKSADAAWQSAQATAAVAAETNNIAQATQQSVGVSADTAYKSLRAYLSVTGSYFDFTDGEATAVITLKNTGKTFAHKVVASATFVCLPAGEPVPLRVVEVRPPPSIGPEGKFDVIRQLQWGGSDPLTMNCYISGSVQYQDVYGRPHTTNFNFVIGRRYRNTNKYEMVYSPIGNDAN